MSTPSEPVVLAASASLPYFALFASDWLSSTSVLLLTAAEEGTFLRLLAHSWLNDGLPASAAHCAKLTKLSAKAFSAAWLRLEPMFPLGDDGKRRNPRQELERTFAQEKRERRSAAGRKGAVKRWPDERTPDRRAAAADRIAIALPMANAWQCDSNAIAMLSEAEEPKSSSGRFVDAAGKPKASEHNERSDAPRFGPHARESLGNGADTFKTQDKILAADSNAIGLPLPTHCVGIHPHTHTHSIKENAASDGQQPTANNREAETPGEPASHALDRRVEPERRGEEFGHATRVLTAAANKGISEKFGEQPMPLNAGSAGSYRCAEALLTAGVALDFAADAIFECARTLLIERPPRSLGYFLQNVLDRWAAAAARRDAASFTPTTSPTTTRPAEGDQLRYAAMRYAQEGNAEWQAYCDERHIEWQGTSA